MTCNEEILQPAEKGQIIYLSLCSVILTYKALLEPSTVRSSSIQCDRVLGQRGISTTLPIYNLCPQSKPRCSSHDPSLFLGELESHRYLTCFYNTEKLIIKTSRAIVYEKTSRFWQLPTNATEQ